MSGKTVAEINAVKLIYDTINDKFGKDIVVLNIGKISTFADYFIIATGGSAIQLKAMTDEVNKKMSEYGIRLGHSEGYQHAKWILLDFGDIIVHLFNKEEREFYNLERIWADAEVVEFAKE